MQSKVERNQVVANIWTARIIPIILAGVVAYATYVLVVLLCVNYLLVKHHDKASAIPILVVYFLLFILMTASFLRLVHITTFDPPYLPLGPSTFHDQKSYDEKGKTKPEEDGIATGEYDPGNSSGGTSTESAEPKNDPDSPGLELFYTRDVFVCEMDGKPKWCSQCANWKPDRAHHCSSAGRCILKMDHFCPWVGGPIGENNFKFFIQFTGYTAFYCTHILVVMAIYIRKQLKTEGEEVTPQFCVILGLAAFFGLFTAGMSSTSLQLAMNNLTTVERLGAKTKVHILAVLKPSAEELFRISPYAASNFSYPEITYPLGAGPQPHGNPPNDFSGIGAKVDGRITQNLVAPQGLQPFQGVAYGLPSNPPQHLSMTPLGEPPTGTPWGSPDAAAAMKDSASSTRQPETLLGENQRPTETLSPRDLMATRTFAILRMLEPGHNPWDLGSSLLNLETVMGTSIFDWLFPIRRSPCCNHENMESLFQVGPTVDLLRAAFYFIEPKGVRSGDYRKRRKRDIKATHGEKSKEDASAIVLNNLSGRQPQPRG